MHIESSFYSPNKTAAIAGLAALVLFAMVPVGSIAKTPRFEAIQLVRYVKETEHFSRQEYRPYARKVLPGTLTYDNQYRHPDAPPGPTPADCTKTGRVGVTFLLTRKSKPDLETVYAYFVWAHSNIGHGQTLENFSRRRTYEDGENGVLISDGIPLTDEMRVDGIISVRVLVRGHEVLENSFSLSNCSQAN